ncbi:SDR family NAD(P)-dependent oxidoreductase [Phenylobacterium sp.]|jgi:NADP-dependent 3-hydroxy acid dehydrogenase YdfG|uniref:SDR family NAD(P)-dependent oxidoreductase n=1 Tax=Phenylobacterium sp. TaxID=1871053 RepID=UPI002F3EE564
MARELTLAGRGAVVTGAASGIGAELAREAARRGMGVAVCDINAAGLEQQAAALRGLGATVVAQVVDVRDASAVARFGEAALSTFPSIALTFANAGLLRRSSAIRPDLDDWNLTIDVNLRGVMHVASALAGPMADRGEPAQFVITGSQASFVVGPELSSYAATKHALWAYADIMRLELAMESSELGVSLICPGRVRSGLTAETRLRVVAVQGEAAARQYDTQLMDPAKVAALAFEQAVRREFWVLPSTAYGPAFRNRIDGLLKTAAD